jgi:hypothetical protein
VSAFTLISGRLQGPDYAADAHRRPGHLFRRPVANGSSTDFWNIATFSDEIREELAKLPEGATIPCAGAFRAEMEEWKGVTRIRLKMTADCLHALKPTPKAKKKGSDRGERKPESSPRPSQSAGGAFDDDITF